MENKVLAPILAGIGLGWLAFSPDGQKMAKSVGQTIMPALAPARGKDESAPGKDGDEAEKPRDKEEDDA